MHDPGRDLCMKADTNWYTKLLLKVDFNISYLPNETTFNILFDKLTKNLNGELQKSNDCKHWAHFTKHAG